MSEMGVQPVAESTPAGAGLTQWQRVANTFAAPSKTFEDIKRGNRSWWLPFVLFIAVGTALWGTVTVKVGWPQVVENGLRMAPKQAERLQATSAGAARNASKDRRHQPGSHLGSWARLGSFVQPGRCGNSGGHDQLRIRRQGHVWAGAFGELVRGFAGADQAGAGHDRTVRGVAPESFLPGNPAGTNIGYYFSPTDMPMMLWGLLVALDVTFIWTLTLFSKGLAKVAGTNLAFNQGKERTLAILRHEMMHAEHLEMALSAVREFSEMCSESQSGRG